MRKKKDKVKKIITVLLIVEGNTEKKLFDYINQKQKGINFTVKYVGTGEYHEIRKKLEIELKRNNTYDKIFCIFDGDLIEKGFKNFEDNIQKMKKFGAEIICSYRCIENWFLYFFDNFSTGSMDSNTVKTRLIKVSNGKYNSETDFDEEFFYNNLVKANIHAKRIAEEKGYDGKNIINIIKLKSEPFTNIYELFEELQIGYYGTLKI